MKSKLIAITLAFCLCSTAALADSDKTSNSSCGCKKSCGCNVVDSVKATSNKIYLTTKDKTKHVIKLTQEQADTLQKAGKKKYQELQKILSQYHFQSPIAKDNSSKDKSSDDSSN